MKNPARAHREAAEMLAVQALGFLAGEPKRIAAFLSLTGLDAAGIRAAANEPGFLAGVLDHMLADEVLLAAFAEAVGIDPAAVAGARRALGGTSERDLP